MTVWLIDGTDVVEMDAVVLFQPTEGGGHELGKAVVAVRAEIQRAVAAGVGGQPVLGEVDGR